MTLKDVLTKIRDGNAIFTGPNVNQILPILEQAKQRNYIYKVLSHFSNTRAGRVLDRIDVPGGLTDEGQEYLKE